MAVAQKPENTNEPRRGKLGKPKWVPKKWRPEYDRVVAYSVLGKANTWIAQNLQFTPEHVSVILHLPEAIALSEKLQARLRENIITNIPDTLEYVARKATERLKEMVDDDQLFKKSPFAVIDRGVDILKGLSHLRGGGNGAPPQPTGNINIGTVVNISPGQKSDIMDGLEKVAEVARLHAGNSDGTDK